MIVKLTEDELRQAAYIGVDRRVDSLYKNRKTKIGFKKQSWAWDCEGAAAEYAVLKALGYTSWKNPINTFKEADIGGNLQVRSTPLEDGSLIIRDDDNGEHIYVLVTGEFGVYNIRGWLVGCEGMKEEYLKNPDGLKPAWFVPQNALHAFAELSGQNESSGAA